MDDPKTQCLSSLIVDEGINTHWCISLPKLRKQTFRALISETFYHGVLNLETPTQSAPMTSSTLFSHIKYCVLFSFYEHNTVLCNSWLPGLHMDPQGEFTLFPRPSSCGRGAGEINYQGGEGEGTRRREGMTGMGKKNGKLRTHIKFKRLAPMDNLCGVQRF